MARGLGGGGSLLGALPVGSLEVPRLSIGGEGNAMERVLGLLKNPRAKCKDVLIGGAF